MRPVTSPSPLLRALVAFLAALLLVATPATAQVAGALLGDCCGHCPGDAPVGSETDGAPACCEAAPSVPRVAVTPALPAAPALVAVVLAEPVVQEVPPPSPLLIGDTGPLLGMRSHLALGVLLV